MMTLKVKEVHRSNKDYEEIDALKNRAFPKIEQLPGLLLLMLALRKSVNYRAFYDGDEFCGLLYTAETDSMVFVLFLAVNDRLRSRGYGSAILSWLKEHSEGKAISLTVEAPYAEAANIAQRRRRLAFYLRNGFCETGWEHHEKGEVYMILCSGPDFSPKEYLKAMKVIGCGFYRADIKKWEVPR